LLLDSAGYSETTLRSAWRDATNEDIAASIIGFIRQAALEMPWLPMANDRAMAKSFAAPQRRWLERIGKQLKVEVIVDREAHQGWPGGGFDRLNQFI